MKRQTLPYLLLGSLITPTIPSIALAEPAGNIPTVIVEGHKQSHSRPLFNKNTVSPDSTELVRSLPGAAVVKNGPMTGFAQYRGMFGQRINTVIDGTTITAGGPNWMDAPLHYAPTAKLKSIRVYRGIAPVSSGQETIGGSIVVDNFQGSFAASSDWKASGDISLGGESNNSSNAVAGIFTLANQNRLLSLSALQESGDDSEFDAGTITPTEYDRSRFDLHTGFKQGAHEFYLNAGRNETGDAGTPALPMDIKLIDTDLFSAKYSYTQNNAIITAQWFGNEVEHVMTNHELRTSPANMMRFRTATAVGDSDGFKVNYQNTLQMLSYTVGLDAHSSEHSTDITNPNSAMFLVENFDGAERELVGAFAEFTFDATDSIEVETGVRVNQASTDSDEVSVAGMMGMMAMNMNTLTTAFNAADRSKEDTLVDWVLSTSSAMGDNLYLHAGVARKNRAPSYQERYLWAPLESTGGLADGNTYIGDIDLEPEVAHEINLGLDWSQESTRISPRLYYRDVKDYIQGTPVTSGTAMMVNNMMNPDRDLLQFTNVDAKIYGVDINWNHTLTQNINLRGVVNYVRGERKDIDDNLYRISPLNMLYALDYQADNWGVSVENHLFNKQDKVSETNNEQQTSGYGLVAVSAYTELDNGLTLTAGIDNLLDKTYQDHLAGYNRATNADIAPNVRLPGKERNLYLKARYKF